MMNKLDQLDEFFLGKDHPFRLPPDVVSALPSEKRQQIITDLQNSWIWNAFFGGLGVTCIGTIAYFRWQLGQFPTDVIDVVGCGIITPMASVLGGVICAVIGETYVISRGLWNGLLTIGSPTWKYQQPEADNSKMFKLFREGAIHREQISQSQLRDYHARTNYKSF